MGQNSICPSLTTTGYKHEPKTKTQTDNDEFTNGGDEEEVSNKMTKISSQKVKKTKIELSPPPFIGKRGKGRLISI